MNVVQNTMPLKFPTVFSEKRHPSGSLVKVMSFTASQGINQLLDELLPSELYFSLGILTKN